jgi:signal transduction histidine kinase
MALVLARMICIPMQRMGQAANKLAQGDYDTRFYGGGYREAEELAEALNFAASELQKNDSLQRELVANISHDLRTPLTMIKGYGEVMRDIPDENTPENIQVIIDETERLTELVNDMLDLSKIKSGTRGIELEVFDLTEAISALLMRYERFTDNQYVINFVHDESVFVRANRNMILQATYNLVNNAINYTGDDKTVIISQRVSDGRVRISVTDTGKGIAKEDLPYIWDRYYRVDKVHKRAVVGTGLGLSIVKGVLEAHHANFGVESELGEGSTFYFELNAVRYDYAVSESNAE